MNEYFENRNHDKWRSCVICNEIYESGQYGPHQQSEVHIRAYSERRRDQKRRWAQENKVKPRQGA